jgi:hypothetical protein
MKRSIKLAAVAALGLCGLALAAGPSSAMPMATAAPAAPTSAQPVAWGCGPGWHPNPWGRCVPNGPVYYWHGPVSYGWGWHRPWGWQRPWHRW